MRTNPKVKAYLDQQPADRRVLMDAIRKVIRANLSDGLVEGMQYGMVGYYVPFDVYPNGYHCDTSQPLPWGGLANRAGGVSLYFFALYGDADEMARFQEAWKKTGKRLDMGKSCIRMKKLEDVPLDVIGRTVKRLTAKRFIKIYETSIKPPGKQKPAGAKATRKKTAAKKTTTKKAAAKKTTAKRKTASRKKTASRSRTGKRAG